MKKDLIRGMLLASIFMLFFGGYLRHDVAEEEMFRLAAEKQFDAVGRAVEGGKTAGSGVLIAPAYVLSAAHILLTPQQLFTRKATLNTINAADFRFEFNGKPYQVKRIIVHPDAIRFGIATGHDLLIAELENPVTEIEPATLNTSFDELKSIVTGVGFGSYGAVSPLGAMEKLRSGKKNAGRNVIDELSGKTVNGQASLLLFDFDSPNNPAVNKMGDATPVPMEYIPSGGDSGGGLFRQKNNKWELVGILHGSQAGVESSRNNGYYGEITTWTRVAAFADWIHQVINQ